MKAIYESILTEEIFNAVCDEFLLEWHGIHGLFHWLRVRRNGLALGDELGGNYKLIELFALLHDCQRKDNGLDINHGKRASLFIERKIELFNGILSLAELRLLRYACEYHSIETLADKLDVQICWDADRLDLDRTGLEIDKAYLNTNLAKKDAFISKIDRLPINFGVPDFIARHLDNG